MNTKETCIVSIIMPAYNAERYISQAIDSVIAQTYSDWELIVVDDSSNDSTASIVNRYQKIDDRIKYFKTDNPSGSPTLPRNIAIEKASGRYIAFLDSDDLWLPQKLNQQLSLFERGNNIAIVYSYYEKIDQNENRNNRIIKSPHMVSYLNLLKGNCIGCLTAMYDTQKVGKVYFERIGHEDYLLWLTILKKGFLAKSTTTVTALYREGNDSVSSNKLKILHWVWNILRNKEQLPFHKAIYYYMHYAVSSFVKSLK